MIEFLSDGLKAASVLLLIAFGYVVIRHENSGVRKVILMAFLLTLLAYQLAYWQPLQAYPLFNAICFYFSMQVPLAFWIMSRAFFDDDFNYKRWRKLCEKADLLGLKFHDLLGLLDPYLHRMVFQLLLLKNCLSILHLL